ncbi:S1 RNA binding domain-containing protein [Reticulomyxa filosa]|uniref:S1 RNA binding domain-containing protein n=1 Tax=Reticulomyxa filosa TaxID=46433 RepID=X6NQA7_RETFI|nr:S1 RNA binding domain-containing protein [Reticulomyxa filosa]|eukprot:ETO27552.1 S1 RNA binding domain-containing protein [Reticulomyxa filosa]
MKEKYEEISGTSQGKSLFESLVQTYPSRVNIWKKYALTEYKHGHEKHDVRLMNARTIFEKAVQSCNNLTDSNSKIKNIKWLFKEYLAFEKAFGYRSLDHSEWIQRIKDLAKQFVLTQQSTQKSGKKTVDQL